MNFVPTIKRFHVDAPGLQMVPGGLCVFGKCAFLAGRTCDFSLRHAFSLSQHKHVTFLVSGGNALLHLWLVALPRSRELRLRRCHCHGKCEQPTTPKKSVSHVILLMF